MLSEQFFLALFSLFIASLIGLCVYLKYVTYKYWSSRGIAEVGCIPPLGIVWSLVTSKKSMGIFFRDLYLQFRHAPVVGMYMLHRPHLMVNDPDLLRIVLTKDFTSFHDHGSYCNEKLDPLRAHLFSPSENKWKNLRNKLTPTFTSGKMRQRFFILEETGRELVIKDLIVRYSTDLIATLATFGVKVDSLPKSEVEFLEWNREIFEPKLIGAALIFMCPELLEFFNVSIEDKKMANFLISIFKGTDEYTTENNMRREENLYLLMQLMTKVYAHGDEQEETVHISDDASRNITLLEAAAQAFVFWVAGFETSSSTATFCLYELSIHQDIQDKLAQEINEVLEKYGGLTYESVNAMHYLHKVVSETLRKYPPLPILNRQCTQDIDLPDINLRVAKDTAVFIPVLGFHWDPNIYPEPEKFDPERFNDENIAGRRESTYLPFGEGPGSCISIRFGLLQTKIGLVSLLSKYRVKPGPNMKVPLEFDRANVVLSPKGGVTLRMENRSK